MNDKIRIIFSSTRGWNPGDEFILIGIRNLLDNLGIDYAEILYNRHPAVRTSSSFGDRVIRNTSFIFAQKPDMQINQHRHGKRIRHFDNSFFPTNFKVADFVIFAGTPEWAGKRNSALYRYALAQKIPGAFLGVGLKNVLGKTEREYIEKYIELITTRDDEAQNQLNKFGAIRGVCPALFCADDAKPITDVKQMGIVFQGTKVWANSISKNVFSALIPVYRELLARGAKIICHHFADVIEAMENFGESAPIIYSSDTEQLVRFYRDFDIVIGTRLHGIGASASFGIPGILIAHDDRTGGSGSFLETIARPDSVLDLLETTDWIEKSKKIIAHKQKWLVQMLELLNKTSLITKRG